jgi:hypothetical protein
MVMAEELNVYFKSFDDVGIWNAAGDRSGLLVVSPRACSVVRRIDKTAPRVFWQVALLLSWSISRDESKRAELG